MVIPSMQSARISPHLLSPSMLLMSLRLKPPALQLCICLFVVCSVVSRVPSLVVVKCRINVAITCLGTITVTPVLAVGFGHSGVACAAPASKRDYSGIVSLFAGLCCSLFHMYKPIVFCIYPCPLLI